jgi:hypothetical protein
VGGKEIFLRGRKISSDGAARADAGAWLAGIRLTWLYLQGFHPVGWDGT